MRAVFSLVFWGMQAVSAEEALLPTLFDFLGMVRSISFCQQTEEGAARVETRWQPDPAEHENRKPASQQP
jgi:hypothetical protein